MAAYSKLELNGAIGLVVADLNSSVTPATQVICGLSHYGFAVISAKLVDLIF